MGRKASKEFQIPGTDRGYQVQLNNHSDGVIATLSGFRYEGNFQTHVLHEDLFRWEKVGPRKGRVTDKVLREWEDTLDMLGKKYLPEVCAFYNLPIP